MMDYPRPHQPCPVLSFKCAGITISPSINCKPILPRIANLFFPENPLPNRELEVMETLLRLMDDLNQQKGEKQDKAQANLECYV